MPADTTTEDDARWACPRCDNQDRIDVVVTVWARLFQYEDTAQAGKG